LSETNASSSKKKWLILVTGIWLGVCIGAAVIIYLAAPDLLGSDSGSASGIGDQVLASESDSPAKDFELLDVSGQSLRLSELRGQVVVFNFWATWCGPCVKEMPMFQKYQDDYPSFVMLGINMEEPESTVKRFLEGSGIRYRILLDTNAEVTDLYKVWMLPTTVFVDEEGIVRFLHVGEITEQQLQAYLGRLGVIE
jgi:thiol-disulfide isomerase/thioredoxin